MQIIYAAPFFFAAGSFFILLSSFSATRRDAITVPAGILAFGLGSLIVYLFSALIGYKVFGHQGPATSLNGAAYVLGGLASSFIFAKFVRSTAPSLNEVVFRLAVAGSAFCSYFAILMVAHVALNIEFHYADHGTFAIGVFVAILLASTYAGWHWFKAAEPAGFFPRPIDV